MPTKVYPSPTPQEVSAYRLDLGLTQAEAAHLVMTAQINWQRWEKKGGMPAGIWELVNWLGPQIKRSEQEMEELPGRKQPRAPRMRLKKEGITA